MVRQIRAACRSQIAPSATAAATCGNRAGRRLTGQGPSGPELRRQPHPPGGFPPADPQPLGQQHRRRRTPQLGRNSPRLHLGHQRIPDRGPLPNVDLQGGHQLQQLITGQRGQVNGAQLLPAPRPAG